jgi:hypothetical protein
MDKKLKKVFNEKAKQARKDYIRDNLLKETLMDMFKDELAHYSEKEVYIDACYGKGIFTKWEITPDKNYALVWSEKQAQKVIELFKERFPNATDIQIEAINTNKDSYFTVKTLYIPTEYLKESDHDDYEIQIAEKDSQALKSLMARFFPEQSPIAKKKLMELLEASEGHLGRLLESKKRKKIEEEFNAKYKAEDIQNVFKALMDATKDFSEPHFKFHSIYGLVSLTITIKLPRHLHIIPEKWNYCHRALEYALRRNKYNYPIRDVKTIDKETIEVIIDNTQGW